MDPADTRGTKDFEGVYLLTPTKLIRALSFNSENKYDDLSIKDNDEYVQKVE